jgi:hypothetical protein
MKLYFTVLVLPCLFSGVLSSVFMDGVASGFIISSIESIISIKTQKIKTMEYTNFTKDTSFQIFPPVDYQCVTEKIMINSPPPTLMEKNINNIFVLMALYSIIHIVYFSDDDETREWFIGYIFGRMIKP